MCFTMNSNGFCQRRLTSNNSGFVPKTDIPRKAGDNRSDLALRRLSQRVLRCKLQINLSGMKLRLNDQSSRCLAKRREESSGCKPLSIKSTELSAAGHKILTCQQAIGVQWSGKEVWCFKEAFLSWCSEWVIRCLN